MEKLSIIYETRGKAREYPPLAVELYKGCMHGCKYCFVPGVNDIPRDEFYRNNGPVENALKRLEKAAKRLKERNDDREILLCFHSDPYQPFEDENQNITSQAIEILKRNNLWFTI